MLMPALLQSHDFPRMKWLQQNIHYDGSWSLWQAVVGGEYIPKSRSTENIYEIIDWMQEKYPVKLPKHRFGSPVYYYDIKPVNHGLEFISPIFDYIA